MSLQPIPRRIIQTGKTRQLTLAERGFAANAQLLNPTFAYDYYDDADIDAFIDTEFPEYRSVIDGFPYKIQKIDFFRYLVVFRRGGFYFDLDVVLAKSLEPLLRHGCVLTFESIGVSPYLRESMGMDLQIGNYAFGASAGHPFLAAVIENCVRAQRDPDWLQPMMRGVPSLSRTEYYVLNSTGPGLVSRTFAQHAQSASDITILMPHDVCDKSSWHQFGDYGVHYMAGSWRPPTTLVRRKLAGVLEGRLYARMRADSLRRRAVTPKLAPASHLPNED